MTVFDIIGPVMIGPSSSHTAGAVRIGRIAGKLLGERPQKAVIKLHGSFARTYRGHGTDKAIIGGLLGFDMDDPRIRLSMEYAARDGFEYSIIPADLGMVHPNTALIEVSGHSGGKIIVLGCSIGGGNIIIKQLNGVDVEFNGQYNTMIVFYNDTPGIVAAVSSLLAENNINIAYMKVYRLCKGGNAIMVIETDQPYNDAIIQHIEMVSTVNKVAVIEVE